MGADWEARAAEAADVTTSLVANDALGNNGWGPSNCPRCLPFPISVDPSIKIMPTGSPLRDVRPRLPGGRPRDTPSRGPPGSLYRSRCHRRSVDRRGRTHPCRLCVGARPQEFVAVAQIVGSRIRRIWMGHVFVGGSVVPDVDPVEPGGLNAVPSERDVRSADVDCQPSVLPRPSHCGCDDFPEAAGRSESKPHHCSRL